ncbi:hypothetical protein PGT21_011153 [Puccinia graminis f. sp. tritici]|uniref:Uncharacterized protein n=1 Tax=Puccinia graminis f. sp. tritici TaxID=56615 RepID=A0A5B0QI01_PUCGR|nr:hypothetical protein PGT21_011153 [Puccinia graminis f. sp. tritici]
MVRSGTLAADRVRICSKSSQKIAKMWIRPSPIRLPEKFGQAKRRESARTA